MGFRFHFPSVGGTSTEAPDRPLTADHFAEDTLSEIDDHFLLSASGFPPDEFDDLRLPVVDPEMNLNLPLLQQARRDVDDMADVDDSVKRKVLQLVENLAADCFPEEEFA